MIIDEKLLGKLEKLSFVNLGVKSADEVLDDFDGILKFIDVLNEVNTDNLSIKMEEFTPLRDDVVEKSGVIFDILKNAPSSSGNFFSVPKILD